MTKLKIGDNVVMNDRYYDKHQGEVFTIKAGPEMIGRKQCFWLDGYDGAYCADGLDLYKPPTNEEWLRNLSFNEFARVLYCMIINGERIRPDLAYIKRWLKEKHDESV